jgi:transposase InsO family protein
VIDTEKAHYPVRVLCRALGVTPSGYYAWRQRPLSARAQRDAQLAMRLRLVHAEHRGVYGRPRLQRALRAHGIYIGEKRVRRLMRVAQLTVRHRRRFRSTTDSHHAQPVAPNHLARRFAIATPNHVWAADITALRTQQGWCYLSVVLDLASRRVVGWAVGPTLETTLPLAALHMAVARRPNRGWLLHHSDRGAQYASAAYQRVLAAHGITASMSRVGDCWDNAPVESFFSSLKAELADPAWRTHQDAHATLADHIENFYNRRRLHSALGYQSPVTFEQRFEAAV